MLTSSAFNALASRNKDHFHPVVPFDSSRDKLLLLDFTEKNKDLHPDLLQNTQAFSAYINNLLHQAQAKYGIGGYAEHRTIYSRSELFGPSPITSINAQVGAKAPSRWEGDEELDSFVEEETIGYRYADPTLYGLLKDYALKYRSVPTEAEEVLWRSLKTKQLNDYKFRRQHIIDCFIADFVCLKKKLVVEVDGLIHQLPENQESDEQRTTRLNELGFTVIRLTNEEVMNNLDSTLQKILSALKNDYEKQNLPDLSSPTGGQGATRRFHLGIDIWGRVFTKVMAPLDGIVHSFAFNNGFGNYGATIILTHNLEGFTFYTLYGHLSLNSLKNLHEGEYVRKGDVFTEFGPPAENGQWPPHLHFQIILDLEGMKGDYPGVCAFPERERYLANCPDPDLILQMNQYI